MAFQVGLKTITVTLGADAKPISNTPIKVPFIEIHNKTGNSSCFVGDSTVDSTWVPIAAGATKSYTASEISASTKGDYFDLSKMYVAGTAADDVIFQYLQVES